MKNQWTINEKQRTPIKNNEQPLFLKVYGKPKPATIWKTNEQSMNTNENQLFLKVYGRPKPAKIWKTNKNQWTPMKINEQLMKNNCFKGLWEA